MRHRTMKANMNSKKYISETEPNIKTVANIKGKEMSVLNCIIISPI